MVGVVVGTDTIARFLAEVNGEPEPQRTSKRPSCARHRQRQSGARAICRHSSIHRCDGSHFNLTAITIFQANSNPE
jgi:hypothetical protein